MGQRDRYCAPTAGEHTPSDMTKGRARIPLEINTKPMAGDIHKYSANAIERVHIAKGAARDFVELYAGVEGSEMKKYQ